MYAAPVLEFPIFMLQRHVKQAKQVRLCDSQSRSYASESK